ncbi:hypothetical protein RO3G_01432 [Rhizopus delemar RA 99-880]|uniref:SAP domain-containing protein n=3 Tax=Rhizopus TaxID=4842 RepID=I1BKJ8_RHIO9|nr:hypothetical protein RO3G_01432 [Rhizopus delemar RA 99-880]|eukprot:EIE76728.1 hypothetical protein RO3G_01432 [Rhizopus delemar RA 99-880]
MSLFKRSIQVLSNRSIHTSFICQEWTKSSLKKMKKTELLQLAKEHHVQKVLGTKNEIIDQLLDLQKPQKVEKPLEKPQVEMDTQWVTAFENKVAQRQSTNKKVSKGPHPMNDNIFKKPVLQVQPVVEEEQADKEEKKEEDDDIEDDVNKEWVEAFEMKVSSRGSRSQKLKEEALLFTAESTKNTAQLLVNDNDKTEDEKLLEDNNEHKEVIADDKQLLKDDEISKVKADNKEESASNNNTVINATIGSSLLIWYFGGQEAFIKIWEFFSS